MSDNNPTPQTYLPNVKKRRGISPLWAFPLLTLLLAGWLVLKALEDSGDRVHIYFNNAQGLIAGRTTIRFEGLEVGMVRDIKLAKDLSSIYVEADIYPEAQKLVNKGTRFWMVKPVASLSGISGLETLVSGNYIAIEPGTSKEPAKVFTALKSAPADLAAKDGLSITLKAKDLGGISVGSQIFYRKIPIGEVYQYKLNPSATDVLVYASIDDKYRHIINDQSRFWNVSGIGASLGFNGIDVHLESLSSLIGGGIAVDSPDDGAPIEADTQFRLYPNLETAGRGISIKVELPDNNDVHQNAPIMYRGIVIGRITNVSLSHDHKSILASAAVQPAFADMLTTGSHLILQEAELSLNGVANLTNLVTGNFLTIVPGEGDKTRRFKAILQDTFDEETSRSVAIRLLAENTFGLDAGANILYHGVEVGSVVKVGLVSHQPSTSKGAVYLDALIDHQYADLIRSSNRFYVVGAATADLTETGLNVSIPPVKQLLSGAISFTSSGSKKVSQHYPLFQNRELAELAQYSQTGSKTLSLFANTLPPISKGSPLLYRNLPVGNVKDYQLEDSGVRVTVSIDNQYAHLVNNQTVFWNRSGVEIDASLAGIEIKASPLKTLLQGGIAFDTIEGVENRVGKRWKLYPDQRTAQQFGRLISLTTNGQQSLAKGMAIQYQGVKVGEVVSVRPNFQQQYVKAQARVFPEYVNAIARSGSDFWLTQPEIGLNGVKNLNALISTYIQVEPNLNGNPNFAFSLGNHRQRQRGVEFTLQAEQRGSIAVGTPILYRQITVGEVLSVDLGEFADRINAKIEIWPEYAYLVRQNSLFWNVSGFDVSIGLSGANIRTGTLETLLKGGIAFATPDDKELAPKAKAGQFFFLYPDVEEQWVQWRTAIPKP
ncbi:MCE family protein [Vibrio sp. SM6]|uniref:MCE family protein n=1 Tax=Vibrio agarilyticus TaxID=2726741 RepID=A0A7X8TPS8_9VIBR|nr:MlaD family protein [Vibrio agarilyticus]NLS12544.1 MCE family protein [Vibrio agarilyticus]